MAAIAQRASEGIAPPRRQRIVFRGGTVWRWVVLLVTAVYFLLPLWAALRFAGVGAFGSVVGEAGFTSSLALSVRLAVRALRAAAYQPQRLAVRESALTATELRTLKATAPPR